VYKIVYKHQLMSKMKRIKGKKVNRVANEKNKARKKHLEARIK
jgi:hypothetical protein